MMSEKVSYLLIPIVEKVFIFLTRECKEEFIDIVVILTQEKPTYKDRFFRKHEISRGTMISK